MLLPKTIQQEKMKKNQQKERETEKCVNLDIDNVI